VRDAVHRQRLEALRDRLFEPPADGASWSEAVMLACEALDAGDEVALAYAVGHLGAWPPPFRVPPCRCGDGARWLRGLSTEPSTRAGRLRQLVANLPQHGGCPVKGWLIGEGWSPGSSWRCLELWCGQALVAAGDGELQVEALRDGGDVSHRIARVQPDGALVIGGAGGESRLQHRDSIELGDLLWTYWRSPPGTLVFRSRRGMELKRVSLPGPLVTIGRSPGVVDVAVSEKPSGKEWPSLTSPMHAICGLSSSPWGAAPMETPQSHI